MTKFALVGLLVVFATGGFWWWTRGGEGGPAVHNVALSVLSQSLYGARPDKTVKFKQGDTAIISLTADEPMEVFLHGYDVEAEVKPGATSTLQFTANVPGHFPLMIHSLGGDEGSPETRRRVEILLGFVDVLPR